MKKEQKEETKVRLQKYLANQGIASRRKCEEYILEGRVFVNGKQVLELGTKIDPEHDEVIYDGKKVKREEKKYYVLLNKPIGYVTTVKDQFHRETVLDLVKDVPARLVPVGRLDMYTSGALLLSNDGDFVYHLTHPKHEVEKVYNVTVKGIFSKEEQEKLEEGVDIGDYTTRPAKVKVLKIEKEQSISRIQVTIHEGKNRQIRKMMQAIDKKVLALHRTKIGYLTVKDLKLGSWRYLTKEEVAKLMK